MKTIIEKMPTKRHKLIAEKRLSGQRISKEDAFFILESGDKQALITLADAVRQKQVGDTVYYASTLFIHPTNLCELSCSFCSFYAKPGWDTAWFLTPDQVLEKIKEHQDKYIDEIHIVGGLWRECNLDYFQELFTKIKAYNPNLHIKALTGIEYDFLAKLHNISTKEVFQKMISWGLGSLPGGGAENLDETIRKKLAPQKISGSEFLDVHRTVHNLGLKSNITMLYGSIEEWEHIVTHLEIIRTFQDETEGFNTFVPLKYHTENNALGKRTQRIKPKDPELVYALSRVMLDNIDNLKILWNYMGLDEAKKLLHAGGNDLGSTSIEEKIITMAGGVQIKMNQETMESIIQAEGKVPKRIHSGHKYKQDKTLVTC